MSLMKWRSRNLWNYSSSWYTLTRVALGSLLITAGAFKIWQSLPLVLGTSDGLPLLATLLLVTAELALGLWLVSGFKPGVARAAAILAFSVFACYSLIALVQGSVSCGCFGELKISPAVTLLVDLVAVGSLMILRPSPARAPSESQRSSGACTAPSRAGASFSRSLYYTHLRLHVC